MAIFEFAKNKPIIEIEDNKKTKVPEVQIQPNVLFESLKKLVEDVFTISVDLKIKLDHHRPLPPAIVKNLHEYLLLRWIYHSNAIEGNTLTLLETKVVLEGITVGGKVLREHFEVINHRDAILYVEDIIKKEEPFSEWQIRNTN